MSRIHIYIFFNFCLIALVVVVFAGSCRRSTWCKVESLSKFHPGENCSQTQQSLDIRKYNRISQILTIYIYIYSQKPKNQDILPYLKGLVVQDHLNSQAKDQFVEQTS